MYRNITTQEENIPNTIGQTTNITWENSKEELKAIGWRIMPEQPTLQEGYTRISIKAVENDGENGIWEVTDESIRQMEQEEDEYIQLTKSYALKIVENKFLTLCDQLTNNNMHVKLNFDELNVIINSIEDQSTKLMITIQLLAIDAEAKREGGLLWWNTCQWHGDIEETV